MALKRVEREVLSFRHARAAPAEAAPSTVADLRFRALVGEPAWARLPQAVRARFAKRIDHGRTAIYRGEVVQCRMSLAGRLLAQLARLIGGPLPLSDASSLPAVVCVTEDSAAHGQFWTRIYGRARGFPQVIHSSKRFCGPTGLEEHIGAGFGIALRIEATKRGIHFLSDHYFVQIRRLRFRLPRALGPGALRVSHVDCGDGRFAFVLALEHALLGTLVHQTAIFSDCPSEELR